MILREKFEKPNNSIRQLMKKLKRHDTVVVAIAVFIALVLCGGLIYLSTPVVANNAVEEYQERGKEENELTREKLREIKDYLTELDKLVCDNKEGIDSIYETTNEIRENNNKEINNKEVNSATDTSLIKSTITEKMISLDKSVTEIHTSIEKTNEKISEIEKMIISENQSNKKEISDGFASINEQLSVIKGQYTQIQENNLALANEIKKVVNEGDKQINSALNEKYSELIVKLDEMNTGMENRSKETIDTFRTDMQALSNDIDGRFAELGNSVDSNFVSLTGNVDSGFQGVNNNLNNKVSQLDENMNNRFGSLEENVNSYNENVASRIDSHNEKIDSDISGLKSMLETEIGSMNSKLDQVFQSVSEGKRQVASALLTKGITVSSDASFSEISKAIIEMEPTIPGEVEYIRHYHVDGNGEQCEGEEVTGARRGGCFTEEKKHEHLPECYEEHIEYTYNTNRDVENQGNAFKVDNEQYYYYYCTYCGKRFTNPNPNHNEYTTDPDIIKERGGDNITRKKVRTPSLCKYKNEDKVYGSSCGYMNGQIIEARIKYKENGKKPELIPDEPGENGGSDDNGAGDNGAGDNGAGDNQNNGSGAAIAQDTLSAPVTIIDVPDKAIDNEENSASTDGKDAGSGENPQP